MMSPGHLLADREAVIEELPPICGLRARKRHRMRRDIVLVALDLFAKRGYDNTRVVDIVRALDISQPTFFRYFPCKAAVLYEAASVALDAPLRREPAIRAAAETAEAYLQALVSVYADVIGRHRCLTRMIVQHADLETLRAVIRSGPDSFGGQAEYRDGKFEEQMQRPFLTDALDMGRATGEVRDDVPAEQLRAMLWSILLAIVVDWASPNEAPYDLRERFMSAVELFINGCRGSGQQQSAAARRF